jgi:hypothetical protein
MEVLKRIGLAALGLALGLPLLAQDNSTEDVVPDVPGRVEKDLFHPPIRLAAADGFINSGPSWGHCGPWFEDVDGDGVKDLIVGDFSGLFHFYRNEGTNKAARFAKAVNLQAGGVDAQVPIY